MAEWAGPKGRASTKPRRPSGLQNEVHQDATDDEYAGGERHIRVPDSDCVTPETQFRHVEDDADDFGNDLPHDADGSELCIMSPNSLALLNRNQVVKRGEPSGTAINLGSLLSRPAQNTPSSLPTPHFFYPPRKALPTRALKPDVAAAANLAESNVASTAPEPEEATRRQNVYQEGPQRSTPADARIMISSTQQEEIQDCPNPTLPETHVDDDDTQLAFPPVQENDVPTSPPRNDDILEVVPHSNAEAPQIEDARDPLIQETRPAEAPRPRSNPRVASVPKRASGKKLKRKSKHGKSHRANRPPPATYTDVGEPIVGRGASAQTGHAGNATVFQEATSTVENCSLVDAAPLALFESAQTTSAVYSVGANNDHVDTTIFDEGLKNTGSDDEKPRRQEQEHKRQHARHRFFSPTQTRLDVYVPDQRQEVPSATLSSRLQMNTTNPEYREEVEHEGPAPATRTTYAPAAGPDLIIDGEEEQGAVRGTTLNSPQHISPRPMIDPGVNLFGEQQSQGRKTSENLGPRVFDKTLHAVSALDSIRVSKPKKKRKAAGPLHPPITIPEDSDPPKLSSRNDAIVKMLCLALGATESQARETTELNVQAHQTTISSLHKTIGYQDNVIKCHKAENGRLQDEVRSLRETITKQMPNMKKHANGLVKDYENFKAKFKVHQQSCTETVKKMVADFENEKSDLRQEFTNMIDSVDRSRRNTKAALDNCYTRLVISESKKVNLMEQVRQLQHHCEDERKTRADLEQKFMPTLKSLQEHVESSQNVLVEKLDRVLTSLGDNTAEEERDALLKQCNEALHNLQATPFLTAKDVEEAEGRLRLAHTSIASKLDEVVTSVGSDRVPLDDIQRYLRDQLQQLRTEVLRYEEAIGEQHKLENANKLLNQQIKAEKERGVKLEQDVLGYRQSEDGLKSQYAQLERELADFREAAHEQHARLEREFDDFREAANQQDSDPSELEQELINMRHQMRKTEEIARNKTTELNHANYRIQERGNEVARVRQLVVEQKHRIEQQAKQIQQIQEREKTLTEASAQAGRIEETHRQSLDRLKISYENDIRQLREEKEQHRASALNLKREAELVKEKLQRVEEEHLTIIFKSQSDREAKAAADEDLQKLRQTGSTIAAELTDIRQRLAQKNTDYQLQERELADLRKEHTSLEAERTIWHEEKIGLESTLAKTLVKVGTVQKALDARVEVHEKVAATKEVLQNQAKAWHNHRRDMEARMEQARITESKLNDAQTKLSTEKETLDARFTELRAALETKEQEMQSTRKVKEASDAEAEGLRQRLTLAEAAVKEADARTQRISDEKERQLEDHKRIIDQKVEDLVREKMAAKERERHGQRALLQVDRLANSRQHPSTEVKTSANGLANAHTGQVRRKVVRQNNSVLNIVGSSQPAAVHETADMHPSQTDIDHHDTMVDAEADAEFAEDLGRLERLAENGVSAADYNAETDSDTQKTLTMSFDAFNRNLNRQNSQAEKELTSSGLSEPPSSGIIDMNESEPDATPTRISETQGQDPREMLPPRRRLVGTPVRTFERFGRDASVYQAQDRPKSNTAMRIAPPTPNFEQSPTFRPKGSQSVDTGPQTPTKDGATVGSDISSPDYVHRVSSAQKTYGHHIGATTTEQSRQGNVAPGIQSQKSIGKRKSSESQTEGRVAHKRLRSSSQSLPTEPFSKAHQRNVLGTSSRHREQKTPQRITQPSQAQGAGRPGTGESTRYSSAGPKRGKRNARHRADVERFEQELRPSQHAARRGMR